MIQSIRNNLKYKILALACALALYLMYGRADSKRMTTSVSVRAQVQAVNVPQGLDATTPSMVIGLQGPLYAVNDLLRQPDMGAGAVDATVDLQGKGPGTHSVPVKVRVKSPLEPVPGEPPLATVTLESVIDKWSSIEFVPQGSVASGFRWEGTTVVPETATVRGPRSAVEQVARLEAHVPVRNATTDVDRDVEIFAVDSRDQVVPHVRIYPERAHVHVSIARLLRYKVVPIVLQTTGRPAEGYRVSAASVKPLTVTVSGSSRALDEIQAISTEPVDLEGQGRTTPLILHMRLQPPQGIDTVGVSMVQVHIDLASEVVQTQ